MLDLGPLLGLFILLLGCFFLRPCIVFWRTQRQLRLKGIIVQGQVIEREQRYGSRGQPWFYLICSYSYNGQTYVSDLPMWHKYFACDEVHVSVCCLPEDPEMAMVFENDFLRTEWVQRTIVPAIFIIIGLFILIGSPLGVFAAHHP
jgi:hypothetical protein